MAIDNVYSIRNKPVPDVFKYDGLPEKLKNQIVHIWSNFFNRIKNDASTAEAWKLIEKTIAETHGKKTLLENGIVRFKDSYKVEWYFLNNNDVEECLDIVEIVFKFIKVGGSHYQLIKYADESLLDLNQRFLENSIGFQLISDNIIKVDTALLHQAIIKPTLQLLTSKIYENANEEYLNAHEHFRHNRNKDCLNDCLKAFETTMKIICTENKWTFDEKDTASKLINTLIENSFFPDYHGTQLNAIKQVLESGVPTIRNKNGAHGQGVNKIIVDAALANYMLNISGAAIKFLVDIQDKNRVIQKP